MVRPHLLPFLALLLPAVLFGQDRPAQDIRDLMTEQEFRSAGLEKLSPEELESLNIWLYGKIEAEREAAAEEARTETLSQVVEEPDPIESFGRDSIRQSSAEREVEKQRNPDRIESRIVGSFDGWSGATVFHLENGQIWRQVQDERFVVPDMENPAVTIEKGLFGAYFLKVEGYGSRVKVRRIK